MSFANLDFFSLSPVGCIFSTSYHSQLLMYTILPLLAFAALLVFRWTLKSRGAGSQAFRDDAFYAFLTLTYLILPTTSTKILNTFACDQLDGVGGEPGQWVLKSDLSIDCESATHKFFMVYAGIMIAVYPIGIPLMYLVLLARVQGGIKAVLPARLHRFLPAFLERLLAGNSELLLDCGQAGLVNTKIVKLVEEVEEEGVEEAGDKEEVGDEAKEPVMVAHECDHITSQGSIEIAAEDGAIVLESAWIPTLEGKHKPLLEFIAHQSNVGRVFWHTTEDRKTVLAVEVTLSEEGAMDEALRRRAKDEEERTELSRVKFLYAAYEPSCWWFEVFETGRRLLLTGGQVILRPGTPSQIVLNMIICIFSMKVYAAYKPFVNAKADKLAEVAQFQLFFMMLAALCIKVDISVDDNYNKKMFDLTLAGMQFVGPLLLVCQAYIQVGRKGALVNKKTGGAMDDVRKLARSYSEAGKAAKEMKTESLGKKIGNKLRAVGDGAMELGIGIVAKHVNGRFKRDSEEGGGVEIEMQDRSGTERVANPLQRAGEGCGEEGLAPHVQRAKAYSGARSPSGGKGRGGRGGGERERAGSSDPNEIFKRNKDDSSEI